MSSLTLHREFRLQLTESCPPRSVQLAALKRVPYHAARFIAVAAVGKPAAREEVQDIAERGMQPRERTPYLKFSHPGRIDQHPSSGKRKQLAVRRCVASAVVRFSDGCSFLDLVAQYPVDDRRLPHPGRPDQSDRSALAHQSQQAFHPGSCRGTDHFATQPACDDRHSVDERTGLRA